MERKEGKKLISRGFLSVSIKNQIRCLARQEKQRCFGQGRASNILPESLPLNPRKKPPSFTSYENSSAISHRFSVPKAPFWFHFAGQTPANRIDSTSSTPLLSQRQAKGYQRKTSHRHRGLMPFDRGDWHGRGWRSRHQGPQLGHVRGWPILDAAAGAGVLGERLRHRDPSALCEGSVQRMHQSSQLPPGRFQLVLHVVKYQHGSSLFAWVWAGRVVAAVLWRGLQQAGRCLWSGLVKARMQSHTSHSVSLPGNLFILVALFPGGRGVLVVLRVLVLVRVPGLALGVGQGTSALGVPVAVIGSAQADAAPYRPVSRSPPIAVSGVHQQQPARRSCGDDFGGDPMLGGLLLGGHLDPVKHFSFQREVVLRKSEKQLVRASETRPQGTEQTMRFTRAH